MVTIKLDLEGYLIHFTDWTPEFTIRCAKTEQIVLTQEHWLMIHALRNFYEQYHAIPTMRVLVSLAKEALSKENANSSYLHLLFPKGPLLQACRLSGLPKPDHCL